MARQKLRTLLPTGALLGLLWGAVIIPALLSLSVGIVALALWREAFDIVFGVLILSFAAMALTGGIVAIAFLRRSARLAEMQTDFIANVSHELRTPLAGIRLLVETFTLGRADGPERRAQLLERLAFEVRRLEALVARVLNWRRLETGAVVLRRERLSLRPLVEEAVASVGNGIAGAVEADATIDINMADDLPEIIGDGEALTDALRNLVHNAVKFGGEQGPVAVCAKREGAWAVLTVSDQGPGIAAADSKRIFERFYRADTAPPSQQGTGLGLAIARRVVEEHEGSLTVDSDLGAGATFTVQLPVTEPSGVRGGLCESRAAGSDGGGKEA